MKKELFKAVAAFLVLTLVFPGCNTSGVTDYNLTVERQEGQTSTEVLDREDFEGVRSAIKLKEGTYTFTGVKDYSAEINLIQLIPDVSQQVTVTVPPGEEVAVTTTPWQMVDADNDGKDDWGISTFLLVGIPLFIVPAAIFAANSGEDPRTDTGRMGES
ncbi:MAG: hypothetical protein S4CHLAM81_11090 [Chlamydiales bacterium]|nr:hypothetical protein [Chlamydiales bacterium]MCH9635887.1 hypothetical protein [Chlamydiales bacterium]